MKIFLFYFKMAIKMTGSAQNYWVGRVSGNTPIFFRPKQSFENMYWLICLVLGQQIFC